MRIAVSAQDGVAVVRLAGEVDMTNADQVHGALAKELEARPRGLVLELAVEFFDSAGLSVLVAVNRLAAESGVAFGVVASERAARQPIEMTGLHELLTMFADVPTAVGAFTPASSATE
ncbi:STAS domain-containing protein [Lentzea chajnantorensis]